MGTSIIKLIQETDDICFTGALERPGHPLLGKDVGRLAGCGESNIILVADAKELSSDTDVLIDFTSPEATMTNLAICADQGIASVIGTTGLSAEQRSVVEDCALKVPVVYSPNMSVAVNLLFKLAAMAAEALGEDYDAEIVETHHRMKRDAPSGTAVRLAEVVAKAKGRDPEKDLLYSRHGMIGERTDREIGIQTLRAGDIVGEHTLLLAGPGERLEITHRAHSRENFASGAVRAALWLKGKGPGLYTMGDVLGL
jgi:4-hydroxy-tetrahydrodipicolinate reductase